MITFLIVGGILVANVGYIVAGWFRFEHQLFFAVLGFVMVIVGLGMVLGRMLV